MAQNITLLGASYSDVPAVELPKTGGGTATFTDVTSTTATASDVASGKKFYLANGTQATGTASGGTCTLQRGVVRPDATLLQSWSGDYLVKGTKGITIPAYTETSTTLYTGDTLTPTVTLNNGNYRYYVLERFLTIPQYSITSVAKGRQEYTVASVCYELPFFPANTFKALINNTYYASRNCAVLAAGNGYNRCVYFSSASALSVYTSSGYGCAQTVNAPTISSGTANQPTFTAKDPNVIIRGSATYLSSTYFNAITDIRCQWVIELYRIPNNTTSTYGMDGWGHYTQMLHNIQCAQSSTHKLT